MKQSVGKLGTMATMFAALLGSISMTIPAGWADDAPRGTETDLPLPRFVSIDAAKARARRGPSLSYRIDWVYQQKDLPLIVTAEYGHWRRVVDHDGKGGWMHYVLLSRKRTALVKSAMAPMRVLPNSNSPKVAILEEDVVARIDECTMEWCWLEKNGYEGWVSKDRLWGVKAGELIE